MRGVCMRPCACVPAGPGGLHPRAARAGWHRVREAAVRGPVNLRGVRSGACGEGCPGRGVRGGGGCGCAGREARSAARPKRAARHGLQTRGRACRPPCTLPPVARSKTCEWLSSSLLAHDLDVACFHAGGGGPRGWQAEGSGRAASPVHGAFNHWETLPLTYPLPLIP
jgi:hypothetical protein